MNVISERTGLTLSNEKRGNFVGGLLRQNFRPVLGPGGQPVNSARLDA